MSVIWGVPYLLIKVAVGELSPVVVVFGRCVIGAALLLPWTVAKGHLRPALRHWPWLLAFTVLEMTGPWLLLSYAETHLSSSLTGLLVAGVPFVAALIARPAGGGGPGAVLRADPRGRPAARPGDHLRQPRGGRAARGRAARRALHPGSRHRPAGRAARLRAGHPAEHAARRTPAGPRRGRGRRAG